MTFTANNKHSLKHGHNGKGKRTKAYRTWAHILGRCNNASDAAYYLYGAQGVRVCDRWHVFDNFLADMGEPEPHLTIDRYPNKAGNYEPGNCRWATRAEQNRNTRRTILINGKCLKDVCAELCVSYEAMQARIRRGMAPDVAITIPVKRKAMLAAAERND